MKKTLLPILCLLLLMAVFNSAAAEGPIDPYFASSQPIQKRRGVSANIVVPESIMTGVPVTFSTKTEASVYRYSVLSPIEKGSNTYQYNYIDHDGSPDNTFIYTFYFPGSYWMILQTEDAAGNSRSENAFIEVQGENLLYQKIQEIVSLCPFSTDYQKVLWLHDYLIQHAYYDNNFSRYYADGVLMDGYGVCDSYSKAYSMLLAEAGLQSRRITSSTHSWNAVCMEGEWYNIDATWDDPSLMPEQLSGYESHDYFGLPNLILFQIDDHNPDSDYPDCHSITCNYAVRENQMPWHDAVLNGIIEKLNHYESVFSLALERRYTIDDRPAVMIFEPIIPYGLSAIVLEKNGMVFRDHEMTLSINTENINDFIYNIEAHYVIDEQDNELRVDASEIRNEAFAGGGAAAIVISDKCALIGYKAFANMENLQYIYIPNKTTKIRRDACLGCSENLLVITEKDSEASNFAKTNGYCLEVIKEE